MHEVLALIPARGGSKGIPRKNIRPLCGLPLIAYSIRDSLACSRITRTVVSTEDTEIAQVAEQYGAEIPFLRPAELASDATPDLPVFQHALKWLKEREGYQPEWVVHLRPTNPVRSVQTIAEAVDRMVAYPEADSLRSVSWPVQTPYKMWRIVDGFLQPLLKLDAISESFSQPRQSLPEVYWQNGYVDIIRPRTLLEMNSMTGHKILAFPIREPFVEIDYPESLAAAERLLKFRERPEAAAQETVRRHPS